MTSYEKAEAWRLHYEGYSTGEIARKLDVAEVWVVRLIFGNV